MHGRRIGFGPNLVDANTDALHSQPHVFIHEVAHNVGVDHDLPVLDIRADGTVIEGSQFPPHADAQAWRL